MTTAEKISPLKVREQAILNGARELVMRYGIRALTMDDIAQQLGISKKTLYQHVANKAELVQRITELIINHSNSEFCALLEEDWNPIDELIRIYQMNSKMARGINPSLLFELKKYFPESWTMLEQHKWSNIHGKVLDNLNRGMELGLYREDMDAEIISRAYTARIFDLFGSEVFSGDQFSMQKVFLEILIYHIRGISSKAGLKYLESLGTIEL